MENKSLWKSLKQAAEIEEKGIDCGDKESFDFLNELLIYKRKYPGMGGDAYDISKWSKSERAAYSFNRFRDFGF